MKNNFAIVVFSAFGFISMACFNNVHAWPLLFPFIGGIVAMTINKSKAMRRSYGYILQYGFYGALLVCILAIPVIWFLAKDAFRQRITDMGYTVNNESFLQAAGTAIFSLGIIFFITYLLGTAIIALFSKRKNNIVQK